MRNKKSRSLAICCGIVTCVLQCCIIPQFFMRAVPDAVWSVLMLLFPTIAAVVLLYKIKKCHPGTVLWSLMTECSIAVIFHRAIGGFLGFHLVSLEWDLFEFAAYFFFTFGWAIGAALVQFVVLFALDRYDWSREP